MKLVKENIKFEQPNSEEEFKDKLFTKKLKVLKVRNPIVYNLKVIDAPLNINYPEGTEISMTYDIYNKHFYGGWMTEETLNKYNIPYTRSINQNTGATIVIVDEKDISWGNMKIR